MSAHLDAPAYRRAPALPVAVDATAELRRALDQERANHRHTLRALRHARAGYAALMQFAGCCDTTITAKLAAADNALEQFEGVS